MKKSLLILSIFIVTVFAEIEKRELQKKFDDVLHEFSKRERPIHQFPKNTSRNRRMTPGMRTSSAFAKRAHDLFELHNEFARNHSDSKGISKRQTYVGYTISSSYCPYVSITCNTTYQYRTYDGSCNNLANPLYGRINVPYKRFLTPSYQDGVSTARTLGVSGAALPNVRTLSLTVSPPISGQHLSATYTHLLPIFGQFLTHDMAGVSTTTDSSGNELSCACGSTDSNCLPITIPSNDQYLGLLCTNSPSATTCTTSGYSTQTCMNFTRSSATFPDFTCTTSYREQLNLLSSYIDGSQIYGLDSVRASALRTFTGGLLATSAAVTVSGTTRTYLPLSTADNCSLSSTTYYNCFLGGEWRTSENLALNGMQVLFNREHNRIATSLASLNPTWNDETLYQEARKIVIAEFQHIVYNEYLPLVTGDNSLAPLSTTSYYTGYNSSINPSLYNEFGTAAFRFGHSLVRQQLSRYFANNTVINAASNFNLQNVVFASDYAYSTTYQGINSIVAALVNDAAWLFGTFGNQMQNNLFQTTYANGSTNSYDIFALNIQRGRDHGLPGYVYFANSFFGKNIQSWTDLFKAGLIPKNEVTSLQSLYSSVFDIDLYVGGMWEQVVNNTYNVGPTFAYIITQQFKELKNGDRFYYENGPSTSSTAFTLNQLGAIKNVTMAGLLCTNFDLTTIQASPWINPLIPGTSIVQCSGLQNQVNLNYWQN